MDLVAAGPRGGVVRFLQRLGSAEPPGRALVGPTWGCPLLPWEVMGEAEERHLGLARRLKLVEVVEGRKTRSCCLVGEASIHSWMESGFDTSHAPGTQREVAPVRARGLASPWPFPLASPPDHSKWNMQECFLIRAIDAVLHFYGTLRRDI